jgi:hypothetical protein
MYVKPDPLFNRLKCWVVYWAALDQTFPIQVGLETVRTDREGLELTHTTVQIDSFILVNEQKQIQQSVMLLRPPTPPLSLTSLPFSQIRCRLPEMGMGECPWVGLNQSDVY